MNIEENDEVLLRAVKLIHKMLVGLIVVGSLLLFFSSPTTGFSTGHDGEWSFNWFEIVFTMFAIASLIIGLVWPRLAKWHMKVNRTDMDVYAGYMFRITILLIPFGVAVVLRMIRSGWYIIIPMLLVDLLAMVFTFPTRRRWGNGKESKHLRCKLVVRVGALLLSFVSMALYLAV